MKTLDRACAALAVLSGFVLLALIGLTFADVILRYVFAAPILGATDLLQMGMVVVVSCAFPFAWRTGGHIVVDLVPDYGVRFLTVVRDLAVRLIGGAIFALLAARAWVRAEDAALFNEATNMIELPFGPFFRILAAACAFHVLVLCIESARVAAGLPIGFAAKGADENP